MKRLVVLLFAVSFQAHGQFERDLFHVSYTAAPLKFNDNRKSLNIFETAVKFPLHIEEEFQIGGGVGYEALWTDATDVLPPGSIHGASTQLIFIRRLNQRKAISMVGALGIYSDFNEVTSEDIRFSMAVRFKTTLNEAMNFSYGLGYSRQFFGNLFAPFVDFQWAINKCLKLTGPFPLNTKLTYVTSPKTEFSFFLKPENGTYRLSEKEAQSRYVQRKQWDAGFGFSQKISGHWFFNLRAGYSLRRRLEIYDATETGVLSILTFDAKRRKREPYFSYKGNAPMAEIMLAWRIADPD